MHGENAVERNIGEHSNFLHHFFGNWIGGAARDDLRLHAAFHEALDPKLRGLAFLLAQCRGLQDVGQRHKTSGFRAFFKGQLAQSLDIKSIFVIASGAANFNKHNIRGPAIGSASHGQLSKMHLHGAGDMRNHLHIAAKKIAASFAVKNVAVNLARGDKVSTRKILLKYALVGSQVHVGLKTIFKHKYFAVAKWIQSARVDVEVALHLDRRHRKTLVF